MENIQLLFVVEVEYIPPPISLNTRKENFSFDFQNDSPIEVSGVYQINIEF